MLLWTFLPKSATSILSDGVYYKRYNTYANEIKMVDEDYIKENVVFPDGSSDDAAPISCYGSLRRYGKSCALGVQTLITAFGSICRNLSIGITDTILVEFWADEKDILNAKNVNESYMCYDDAWKNDDRKNKWKYAQVCNVEQIAKSDYLDYIRRSCANFDVECMVQCVHEYSVTAIKEFTSVGNNVYKVSDLYTSATLIPTFTGDLYVSSDAYPRALEDGCVKRKDFDFADDIQDVQGMAGCYAYMTLYEVAQVCNKHTIDSIKSYLPTNKDLLKETYNKSVSEVTGNDSFILTF